METWLADPLFGGAVQSGRHLIELFAAFGLTAIIGLERTIQGNDAQVLSTSTVSPPCCTRRTSPTKGADQRRSRVAR
jgi:hypothetical protein